MDPRAIWSVLRAGVPGPGGGVGGAPHVIHCHDAHALQVAILPRRLRGAGLVASRRVHYATSAFKWNRADRVVAISMVVAGSLEKKGIDPARIRTVPSGVDPDELSELAPLEPPLRARLGLEPDAFLVGNVGHLFPYKGQIVLPRAAAWLEGVQWVVAGEGPERPRLEAEIERLGVWDRVHLLGRVPDARRMLPELDLFVFPSVNEALGTTLLDAMVLGLPCVAADALGPAEILAPVRDEIGEGLVPPDDPGALAEAVARLRDAPALRRRLAAAQRRRARDYTAERMVRGTLEVYRELIPAHVVVPGQSAPSRTGS